ncbi:MAG: Mfa1 family fimbria major subunit [Muribaculaceae bacterium]|nr:Mfa1 family fimbria major subunit [Muribaculaceae bacterium]
MLKFKHFIWTLAVLPMLTACSQNDFPDNGNGIEVNENDGVYMTVNFAPNTQKGTRSYTDGDNSSNTGVEVGSDVENKINKVLLVLANSSEDVSLNNLFISYATIDGAKLANTNNTIYQATAKFQKTDLADFYSSLPSTEANQNPKINVYIYCNYTAQMLDFFEGISKSENPETNWVNGIATLSSATDNALWNPNAGFMMTNVSKAPRFFPATMADWNYYTTESNPFDLSGMNNEGTDAEVNNLGTETTPGGAIEVHRMAARFDFADGSQWDKDNAPNGNGIIGEPFTYAIMTNGTDDEGHDQILVKGSIVNLSLVNLFKKEYYLGRVSTEGFNTPSATNIVTLLGAEKPWFASGNFSDPKNGNYVVSPDANIKNQGIVSEFGDYFYYPFFDPATGRVAEGGNKWFTTYVNDLMGDNYDNDATESYKIWRYVTENTLPAPQAQDNGQTTGVVFKVKLKGGEALNNSSDRWDHTLYTALNNSDDRGRGPEVDPVLYAFSGKLYCTWEHVQLAALAAAGYNEALTGKEHDEQQLDYAATLYKAVFGNGCPGEVTINGKTINLSDSSFNEGKVDETCANVAWQKWYNAGRPGVNTPLNKAYKEAVTGANFTIYQTSQDQKEGWGYYCYYYYWNRHNDNGIEGVMAPMEFATVRNNVYKLAVTRLKTLGHPRVPDNDPDEPTPDTPDEKGDIYLTVSVTVKPWVVRFNNIEF